jgi:hypothetical protein
MPGAQPVPDAGDAPHENLGAAGGIGVIGNLARGGPVGPRTFFMTAHLFRLRDEGCAKLKARRRAHFRYRGCK